MSSNADLVWDLCESAMDLSLGKLRQLVTIARSGSFSKAAAELRLSQPALSRSVAMIESRYGFQLFDRIGQGVQLTAAGAQVIAQAEPLLRAMHVFEHNLKLLGSGDTGNLSIGFAPLLASQQLARFAAELFGAGARVELRVLIRSGPELLDGLRNHQIEMCFFPESYIEPCAEIDIETVGALNPVCVVRRGHPLAGRRGLKLDDLAAFPWASSAQPPIAERPLHPARLICDNYHILRDAVLQSDLVCTCSSAFVAEQLADGSLCAIDVEGLSLPSLAVHMAKLRGRIRSPLADNAVRRMRKHLGAAAALPA
jgi:DNA-binding transcriptional LysR family regulator